MSGPVTDAVVEAGCRVLCILDGDKPDRVIVHQNPMVYAWHRYRDQARKVIEAAIAAMNQAAAPPLTERSVPAEIVDLLKSVVHEEDEDLREAASLDLLDDIIAFGMQQAAAPAAPPADAPLPEHTPAVDLGEGLREAIGIVAGQRNKWCEDHLYSEVNSADDILELLEKAALAAERELKMSEDQEKVYDRLKGRWVHPLQLEIDRLKHELHYRKKSEEAIVAQFAALAAERNGGAG